MNQQATATATQGHEAGCLCTECVAFRGGYTPAEYTAWIRSLRADGADSLRRYADRHYGNKRNGIVDPVTVEPPNAVQAHTERPSWRKHESGWVIRALGANTGDVVEVYRKDESHSTETLGESVGEHLFKVAFTPPANTTVEVPAVPEGYYAVDSRTGNNDTDFFKVDCPTEGRWAGRVFVKRVIGGHPDTAVRGAEAKLALDAIVAAGWQAAAERYGREIGRCGKCNRTLTDETSRAFGIGPVCRDGW